MGERQVRSIPRIGVGGEQFFLILSKEVGTALLIEPTLMRNQEVNLYLRKRLCREWRN